MKDLEQKLILEIEKRDRAIKNLEEENKQMENMINKLRMNSTNIFGSSGGGKSMIEMRR